MAAVSRPASGVAQRRPEAQTAVAHRQLDLPALKTPASLPRLTKASPTALAGRFFDCVPAPPPPIAYGLASELTARGASTTEVMLAGNWKTARMVAHYSAGATAERGAVARYL